MGFFDEFMNIATFGAHKQGQRAETRARAQMQEMENNYRNQQAAFSRQVNEAAAAHTSELKRMKDVTEKHKMEVQSRLTQSENKLNAGVARQNRRRSKGGIFAEGQQGGPLNQHLG
jgi:hypothetical protein